VPPFTGAEGAAVAAAGFSPDGFSPDGFDASAPAPALAPSAGALGLSAFFDAYRSAYQPPPFSWKLVRETARASRSAPHVGQLRGGGSEIFCITSVEPPQLSQTYS
jgi:hypothetical protein